MLLALIFAGTSLGVDQRSFTWDDRRLENHQNDVSTTWAKLLLRGPKWNGDQTPPLLLVFVGTYLCWYLSLLATMFCSFRTPSTRTGLRIQIQHKPKPPVRSNLKIDHSPISLFPFSLYSASTGFVYPFCSDLVQLPSNWLGLVVVVKGGASHIPSTRTRKWFKSQTTNLQTAN